MRGMIELIKRLVIERCHQRQQADHDDRQRDTQIRCHGHSEGRIAADL